MLDYDTAISWIEMLGLMVVIAPGMVVATLGISSLMGRPLTERLISRSVELAVVVGLLASVGILVLMLLSGARQVPIELGNW